jgi:hypothetical protein
MLTIKKNPLIVALVAIAASIPLANSQNVRGRVLQRPDRGGPPHPGPGQGLGEPPFPDFYKITCGDDGGDVDFSCDLPDGDVPRGGVFVCRKDRHARGGSFPMCISTDQALVDDECGCCDMGCPTPCDACPCDNGVLVSIKGEEGPSCVPKFASARMAYHRDDVTCFEGCLVESR